MINHRQKENECEWIAHTREEVAALVLDTPHRMSKSEKGYKKMNEWIGNEVEKLSKDSSCVNKCSQQHEQIEANYTIFNCRHSEWMRVEKRSTNDSSRTCTLSLKKKVVCLKFCHDWTCLKKEADDIPHSTVKFSLKLSHLRFFRTFFFLFLSLSIYIREV